MLVEHLRGQGRENAAVAAENLQRLQVDLHEWCVSNDTTAPPGRVNAVQTALDAFRQAVQE